MDAELSAGEGIAMSSFWQKMLQIEKKPEAEATRPEKTNFMAGGVEESASIPESFFNPCGMGSLDPNSPTWWYIKSWAEESLRKSREKNDNINCDTTKTAVLRGEIKMLKELINLPNPRKGLLITDEE